VAGPCHVEFPFCKICGAESRAAAPPDRSDVGEKWRKPGLGLIRHEERTKDGRRSWIVEEAGGGGEEAEAVAVAGTGQVFLRAGWLAAGGWRVRVVGWAARCSVSSILAREGEAGKKGDARRGRVR
jgi:hypothetical protein